MEILTRTLVPRSGLVSSDFWRYRRYCVLIGILSSIRDALTTQAMLVAIGVGDSAATPAAYILITEINAAVGRLLGLFLASVTRAEYFACEARPAGVISICVSAACGIFPLLLLLYPQRLQSISLVQTILAAAIGVVTAPASSALWSHLQPTADPALRAEVDTKISNQDQCLTLVHIALRLLTVNWVDGASFQTVLQLWLALQLVILPLQLQQLTGATPPTLNRDRAGLVLRRYHQGCVAAELAPSVIAPAEQLLPRLRKPWACSLGETELAKLLPEGDGLLLKKLLALHKSDSYVLGGSGASCRLAVALKQSASDQDQLRAMFHAHKVESKLLGSGRISQKELVDVIEEAHAEVETEWSALLRMLREAGWLNDPTAPPGEFSPKIQFNPGSVRYTCKND